MNIHPGKLLGFLLGSYIVILGACSKNNSTQEPPVIPPPVNPVDSAVKVNLYFPGATGDDRQYELIISTANGNVLLDSVSDVDKFTSFTFKTTEKLVDVTTVIKNIRNGRYIVNTFKAVNPVQWDTARYDRRFNTPLDMGHNPDDRIYCYNLPANSNNIFYISSYNGWDKGGWDRLNNSIVAQFSYYRHPGSPVIISLPTLALYKVYHPVSQKDTIQITNWDTTVTRKFDIPSQYRVTWVDLQGSLDTMDRNQWLHLYLYAYNSYVPQDPLFIGADIGYPGKYIQKYQLSASFNDSASKEIVDHFFYGDTVGYRFNFPDRTDYSLTSTGADNFSAKFINKKPTYCLTVWGSTNLQWNVFAPVSDSLSFNLLGMVNSLKGRSQYFSGRDLSDLRCYDFVYEMIDNIDYADYMEHNFNSRRRIKRMVYSATMYSKGL